MAVQIDGASAVTINDVGTLSITPGSGDASDVAKRAFAEAQKALSAKLTALGCADTAGARTRLREREGLQIQAETHKATVAALAPHGIEALATQVAELTAKREVSYEPDIPDIATAEQAYEKCQEKNYAPEVFTKALRKRVNRHRRRWKSRRGKSSLPRALTH